MRLIGQDLFDLERVYARQVPGEDAVDELVGEVGEDELAFRQLGVLDRLNDADDACVQRIDREAYHAKTTRAVTPRQVRQLLQPSTVHTPADSTKMLVDLSFFCRATLCLSATYAIVRWLASCHVRVLRRNGQRRAIVAMDCE